MWDNIPRSIQSGNFSQTMDNLPNRNSVVSLQIISDQKQALFKWTK